MSEDLLGSQPVTVYRPGEAEEDYGRDAYGNWFDNNRVSEEISLVIDPMTSGQLARLTGTDGLWTGGAVHIFSKETPLYPEDDDTGRPADWVLYRDKFYSLVYSMPWDDGILPSYEMAAVLMRPQPQIEE